MKSKQLCLAADERNELERFSKTGARNTRLVNRAKVVLALDTSGGRFRRQSKLETGNERSCPRWPSGAQLYCELLDVPTYSLFAKSKARRSQRF